MKHWAIGITNDSNKTRLVRNLLAAQITEFHFLSGLSGALFSTSAVAELIDNEERHDAKTLTKDTPQALRTMSSGEQKKALLNYLLTKNSDFIILDNPFDNLDTSSQIHLSKTLEAIATKTILIQLVSRKDDLLSFIDNFARLEKGEISVHNNPDRLFPSKNNIPFTGDIPAALEAIECKQNTLILLHNILVKFADKTVLQNINWRIKKREFWQLIGKNGSGKTTLLSMLTGENPKGYGQELFLFGKKKGSGESIWDIKKNIGYFTPSMTDKFTGYHTIENMLISGLNDSIGLYIKPTEAQLRLAKEWLQLIHMWEIKDVLFHELSLGQKRLIMTTRAMIKHPLLFILDEPTAGLDDASAKLLVALVNKIAKESNTATIFVSHRKEPGLKPDFTYELKTTENGSIGRVLPQIYS